jgi:hypothetical protein
VCVSVDQITLRQMVELLANNQFGGYAGAQLVEALPSYNLGGYGFDFRWAYFDISLA